MLQCLAFYPLRLLPKIFRGQPQTNKVVRGKLKVFGPARSWPESVPKKLSGYAIHFHSNFLRILDKIPPSPC